MRDKLVRVIVISAVIGCISGCSKPEVVQEPVAPEPPPMVVIASTPVPSTPAPAPELAPEGVFYLITAVSIETDAGIHALTPGTGVKRIGDDLYLTPYGERKLLSTQVTNDLAVARAAKNTALASQAAIQKSGAATASLVSEIAKTEANGTREDNLKTLQRTEIEKRLQVMNQQKSAIESQITLLEDKANRESYGRAIGRSVSGTSTELLTAARVRLRQLRTDISEEERRLQNISR